MANAVWTIPAERMKAGREHRVPLSEPALAVLREMAKAQTAADSLIFPGREQGKPLGDTIARHVFASMKVGGVTLHGFRSTFRDWAAETGKPNDLAEAALAHTLGSATVVAYQRGDLLERRRHLMAAWASYCGQAAPAAGGNVVALGSGQRQL